MSCHTEGVIPPVSDSQREKDFSVSVPQSRIALYANLSCYDLAANNKVETKSVEGDSQVSLGSLLNFNEEIHYEDGGIRYNLIPFLSNAERGVLSFLYDSDSEIDEEHAASVRKYYIQAQRGDKQRSFIVTMITQNEYETRFPDYDYINKPNYSGLILFSTVAGTIITVRSYSNGRILGAKLLSTESHSLDSLSNIHYAAFLSEAPQTKTVLPDGSILLCPSCCIAYVIDTSWCFGTLSHSGLYSGSGCGPSAASMYQAMRDYINGTVDLESDVDNFVLDWETPPEEECFDISLSCNVPRDIDMIGSGTYTRGTWVYIGYEENGSDTVLDLSFIKWTGSFSGISVPCFLYKSNEDIESTAYFNDGTEYPCRDSINRKTNPLKKMSVAPSNKYGTNYLGGTYGKTRSDSKGNPKKHNGLDLAAIPGTPVFSMYTGLITDIKTDAPDEYVAGSYGNRIRISSTVPNPNNSAVPNPNNSADYQNICVLYAHLQYQNPVAINPRTGMPFAKNDKVYQGELIGYTGKTGNADSSDVPVKHLHLGITHNGDWVDPAPYINGTIDTKTIASTKGEVGNIRCHDNGSNYVLIEEDVEEDDDSNDE